MILNIIRMVKIGYEVKKKGIGMSHCKILEIGKVLKFLTHNLIKNL